MLFIFSYSNLESLSRTHTRTSKTHTKKCSLARADAFARNTYIRTHTPFRCSPSQTGLGPLHCASAYFPLQMTASMWEMSGAPRRLCLASSNICEVLSSSRRLRRAVSQESRLLTHMAAKTASPSALKRSHFAHSFASSKDCISPKFVVSEAALSPVVKVRAAHNGTDGAAAQLPTLMPASSH